MSESVPGDPDRDDGALDDPDPADDEDEDEELDG
jgi:hypothetical protein